MSAAIQHGLKITDVEIMNGHYEETLTQWREAFFKNFSSFARIMITGLFVCGNSILLVVSILSGHKLV